MVKNTCKICVSVGSLRGTRVPLVLTSRENDALAADNDDLPPNLSKRPKTETGCMSLLS